MTAPRSGLLGMRVDTGVERIGARVRVRWLTVASGSDGSPPRNEDERWSRRRRLHPNSRDLDAADARGTVLVE